MKTKLNNIIRFLYFFLKLSFMVAVTGYLLLNIDYSAIPGSFEALKNKLQSKQNLIKQNLNSDLDDPLLTDELNNLDNLDSLPNLPSLDNLTNLNELNLNDLTSSNNAGAADPLTAINSIQIKHLTSLQMLIYVDYLINAHDLERALEVLEYVPKFELKADQRKLLKIKDQIKQHQSYLNKILTTVTQIKQSYENSYLISKVPVNNKIFKVKIRKTVADENPAVIATIQNIHSMQYQYNLKLFNQELNKLITLLADYAELQGLRLQLEQLQQQLIFDDLSQLIDSLFKVAPK